jgi:hypothetical protein
MATREPAVAGMFYPEDPRELERELRVMLKGIASNVMLDEHVRKRTPGAIHGIIVPHAGYVYSGATAARAYALVAGKRYDLIVLLGPSHSFSYRGLALEESTAWRTPLGERGIAYNNLGKRLLALKDAVVSSARAHKPEHSLEVQVPFLQHFRIEGPVAPMLVGIVGEDDAHVIASALAEAGEGKSVLFIVSTDMSHYLSRDERLRHDETSIRVVEGLDGKGFASLDACGRYPLRIIMELCRIKGWRPRLVAKSDSGDANGDTRHVVGYASFVF